MVSFQGMALLLSLQVSSPIFRRLRSEADTVAEAVTGLAQAYGFGNEFAAALSAIAIALTGDPTSGTWSIGGSYVPALLGNLLSNPSGISYSHNTYESDASPGRVGSQTSRQRLLAYSSIG